MITSTAFPYTIVSDLCLHMCTFPVISWKSLPFPLVTHINKPWRCRCILMEDSAESSSEAMLEFIKSYADSATGGIMEEVQEVKLEAEQCQSVWPAKLTPSTSRKFYEVLHCPELLKRGFLSCTNNSEQCVEIKGNTERYLVPLETTE